VPVGCATPCRPKGEDTFSIPREFFTDGWHLALTPSELTMLLALWTRRGSPLPWPPDTYVSLDGETRI
jgi:hypothetical protein